jgi:outer membrane protein assembly factor BamA
VKNKFAITGRQTVSEKEKIWEDLYKITAQKPNRRFLKIFPSRMWLYYSATRGKRLTKFKQWIIDKVGEAPVTYDSTLTVKSRSNIENYFFNIGYFHASVNYVTLTKRNRTTVVYRINPGVSWKIGEVELPKKHTTCDSLVRENRKKTFLKKGDRFSIINLKNERDRIETVLRNTGFFFFNREYITFDLDSNSKSETVNIKITINPPTDSSEHKQYRINNIYVVADYASDRIADTTRRDTIVVGDYKILSRKMAFRKNILADAIFFKRNELYSKDRELKTINRFSLLGTFKFVSLDYSKSQTTDSNYLDCTIQLTPAKRQSIMGSIEVNVTNEGLFGTAGTFSYKNKNLTKGADQLLLDISTGVQLKFSKKEKVQIISTNVNTSLTYYLNRFLVPFRAKLFSRNTNPKTRFNANYSFENRYDFDKNSNVVFLYQLHNFNASFGYEWNENPYKRHLFNPIAINFYLLPKKGTEFLRRLDSIPILKSSYEEQVTIGPNYTFTYSNQKTNTDKVYMYFRSSMEIAGNVIYAGFRLANLNSQHDSLFLIAKRPFSQYFRVEADWRNHFRMDNHSEFALRTFAGIGVPYGNSVALPFIKQFFVGGPNSLRGFLIREVGPGSYVDSTVYNPETGVKKNVGFFNQTGDIKLEMNAEIRFDIYKWLKAAVFADAGNVWTLRKDTRLNSEFNFARFWNEFAVDAGAGLRLDFNYFVVRFDYGFPLRDPRRTAGKRWQFENAQAFKSGQFQLAIGYPF